MSVYAFLFSHMEFRVLIIMDEAVGWKPPEALTDLDIVVFPSGPFEFDPITDSRRIQPDHPILSYESTFIEVSFQYPV